MDELTCDTCYWKTHPEGYVRGCMFCTKYIGKKKVTSPVWNTNAQCYHCDYYDRIGARCANGNGRCMFTSSKSESFRNLCKRIRKKYSKDNEVEKKELKKELYDPNEMLSVERIPFDY